VHRGVRTALASGALLAVACAATGAQGPRPLRIGWTAWADGVFVTQLATRLIERDLHQPVELVRAGIAEQYQGIAGGRIDLMLMSWQPRTHAPYLARVRSRVEDLGVLYNGARLGWAVPAYVPRDRVRSMRDLADPGVRRHLGGRIQGIDPGSGLMRLSREALGTYGLGDYELEAASGPAMTSALDRAIKAGDWIVVTAWTPLWMFAAHRLRYLDDPEDVLGGAEEVHALAHRGLFRAHPRVAAMIARMWLPLGELQSALLDARNRSQEQAVTRYIAEHPARVGYWVNGTLPTPAAR